MHGETISNAYNANKVRLIIDLVAFVWPKSRFKTTWLMVEEGKKVDNNNRVGESNKTHDLKTNGNIKNLLRIIDPNWSMFVSLMVVISIACHT